jgi:hypothetical protein
VHTLLLEPVQLTLYAAARLTARSMCECVWERGGEGPTPMPRERRESGTHAHARAQAHTGRSVPPTAAESGWPHTAAQEDRHPLVRIHRHLDTHTQRGQAQYQARSQWGGAKCNDGKSTLRLPVPLFRTETERQTERQEEAAL